MRFPSRMQLDLFWATWTIVGEATRQHAQSAADEPSPDGRRTRTNVHELRPPDED